MQFLAIKKSHTRYPEYNWQSKGHNHWEREIDETERFYTCLAKSYEGSGRMYFAITGFVSISVDIMNGSSGQDVEDAVRKAWVRLRYDYPTIASRVDYNTEWGRHVKSYTAFHPDHVDFSTESWLSQTFISLSPNMGGLDWCNSDPVSPKHPSLFIITPPYTDGGKQAIVCRDLVLRTPHDISESAGTSKTDGSLLTKSIV